MSKGPALNLGSWRQLDGVAGGEQLLLPARHLVTHGVVVGMTGSGKTGLVTVLVEEALSAGTLAPLGWPRRQRRFPRTTRFCGEDGASGHYSGSHRR